MKVFFILMFAMLSFFSSAHPVIYKDGLALSSANMPQVSNNYILYSFSNRLAVGVEHWRFTRDRRNEESGLAKLNALLYRYNGDDSQGNLYLHAGAGVNDHEFGNFETRFSFLTGVEADWETRKLYSSAKYYQFRDLHMAQARVGFSPKETGFSELQTWILLQAMVIRDVQETVMITPMLRFFYHNVLWEMGASSRGDWMLNLMVHY